MNTLRTGLLRPGGPSSSDDLPPSSSRPGRDVISLDPWKTVDKFCTWLYQFDAATRRGWEIALESLAA
eukprot:12128122-Alexandrium_andersonii.AAC.1